MPTAARAIPYSPAKLYATIIPTQIKIIGQKVELIPTPNPLMIVVAEPVCDCSAIFLTNLYESEV